MAEIICIASQKGGVGKTTTSVHVSAGLALSGFRTLLIDLDPQRNTTSIFFDSIEEEYHGVYAIFRDGLELKPEFFIQTRFENLSILPSSIELSEANSYIAKKSRGMFLLKDALSPFKNHFDFIVIDCPPNVSHLTLNALNCGTGLLIPVQASRFVIDGIVDLLKIHANVSERYNPSLKIIGALLNNYNSRTALSKAIIPLVQKYIPVLKTKITHSVVVEEAALLHQTLYEYDKKHKLTQAFRKVIKEILKFYEV
ncbi:MAG: ParA family protein [Leptospiraceae bacterium]|nr:ParA family protein [Leptospiraceae bacterium]MCP5498955.1 ParA family protein [Leptospiraceae bacterium]